MGENAAQPLTAQEVADIEEEARDCHPDWGTTEHPFCEDWGCQTVLRLIATLRAARRAGFEEALAAVERANPHEFGERCDFMEPGYFCGREDGVRVAVQRVRSAQARANDDDAEGKGERDGSSTL